MATASDPDRYPIVSSFLRTWTKGQRHGTLSFELRGEAEPLCIAYVHYTPPQYFLGLHCLGVATHRGRRLQVTDNYRYHTVGNRGATRFERTEESPDGLCGCGELVMPTDAGQTIDLVQTEPGLWTADVRHSVDQSLHEIESDDYRCILSFDPSARTLCLERSYFRDSST